ncbi:MAG: hypothetical protein A2Y13_02255 [Planctomycetes bacterium GWC2_45_44]|nr:MAG: hypothetical protein A2Y13_02255 [Planctomycetes bacterium GWC2_45_44]
MCKLKIVSIVIVLVLLASQANAAVQDLLVANEAGNLVERYDGVTGADLGAFITAGSGGLSSPEDICYGPDASYVYVAGYYGSVKKYSCKTGAYIGDFVAAGSGGLANVVGMTFGPDKNLYVADFGNSSVKKYNGSTGAYIGDFVAAGSGGLANPRDIKFGPDGNIYVAAMSNYTVKRYNGTTGAYMGDFVPSFGQQPAAIMFDEQYLYVSNMADNNIRRYNSTTGAYVDTFTLPGSYAGAGTYDLRSSSDGVLYAAEAAARVTRSTGASPFLSLAYIPSAITWMMPATAVPDLLVANESGNSVLRYDGITGAALGAFIAAGSGGLSMPEDICYGPDANYVYVASYYGNVKKYNGSTGAYDSNFVTTGSGGLANIVGMTFGPDNNLYIADFTNSSVKKYNGSTGAYIGDFVTAGSGGLANPRDIKFGPDGNIYVAAMSNYCVKRYDGTTGAYIDDFVPAGSLGQQAAAIMFREYLYVSNMANNDIQRYNMTTGAYIDTINLPGSYAGSGTYDIQSSPCDVVYAAEAASQVTRSAGTSPFLSLAYVPSAIILTVPNTVDASTFGYDEVDATTALQAAINSGARTVYVPNMGIPWNVTPIFLVSNQEIIFEDGVLVQAKKGFFTGETDCLFKAEGKTNITLTGYGARFRMRKEDYVGLSGEWRMGVWLRTCSNVNIRGMRIENTGGDGVYIGQNPSPCQNITIKDVVCEDNARNGISVVSVIKLLIENCILRTTSGLAPMCGLDFEPNGDTDKIVNCTVRYSIFESNVDHGIALPLQMLTNPSTETSGTIENCTIISNGATYDGYGIFTSHYLPNWIIKDNLIVNNYGYGMYQLATGSLTTVTYTAFYGNIQGISYNITRGTGCLTAVNPIFVSTDINSPYYMYLSTTCPTAIRQGACDGSYMGAGPAVPLAASSPSPANGATGVSLTPTLSWTAGNGASSHNVYFGTDSTPDETEYIGNQAGTTYAPGTLSSLTTYYWRIDEVGPGGTTTGTVWSFTTLMPTFVAAGAVTSGTGTITPALPAGIAINDILLLFLETSNQAISISNQNGGTWTQVTNSPQYCGTAAGTTGARLTVFWSRYNGTQGAPTTSDSGDHQLGRMIAIRGAISTGNPWDVTAGGVEAVSDTSGSIPGATTTVANTLVVTAIATSLPDASSTAKFSAWTNANLTSVTERTDNSVTAGNGGGLGVATGIRAATGAYGNTAVTLVNAAYKGMMSIAIKP